MCSVVLITLVLQYSLKPGSVMTAVLVFFLKIVLVGHLPKWATFMPRLWRRCPESSSRSTPCTWSKCMYEEVTVIASKKLCHKIVSPAMHLMKWMQRGPVRGIFIKLQEKKRERRGKITFPRLFNPRWGDHWRWSWPQGNAESSGFWQPLQPAGHSVYSKDESQNTVWSCLNLFCIIFNKPVDN